MAGSGLGRVVRLTRPGLVPIRQAVNTTVRKTAGATARSMKNVAKKGAEAAKRVAPRITKEVKNGADAIKKKLFAPNSVGYSRKPSEIFTNGADGGPGKDIKPKHLYRELKKSKIGQETLELIENNDIDVTLSHQAPLLEKPGYTTYGINYDNNVVAYLRNTQSKVRTAQTVIHEVTHGI